MKTKTHRFINPTSEELEVIKQFAGDRFTEGPLLGNKETTVVSRGEYIIARGTRHSVFDEGDSYEDLDFIDFMLFIQKKGRFNTKMVFILTADEGPFGRLRWSNENDNTIQNKY